MKKTLLLLTSVAFFWSCSIGDTIRPRNLEGEWVLVETSTTVQLTGENAQSFTESIADPSQSINFLSDGNYSSNLTFEDDLAGSIFGNSGTFEIVDDNFIRLTVKVAGFQDVDIMFLGNVEDERLTLTLNKTLFEDFLRQQFLSLGELAGSEEEIQAQIDEVLGEFAVFELSYIFQKSA